MSGLASSSSLGVTTQVERKSSSLATNIAATSPAVKRSRGSGWNKVREAHLSGEASMEPIGARGVKGATKFFGEIGVIPAMVGARP